MMNDLSCVEECGQETGVPTSVHSLRDDVEETLRDNIEGPASLSATPTGGVDVLLRVCLFHRKTTLKPH